MALDVDLGVHIEQSLACRLELRPSHIPRAVDDLPLKVAEVDDVEIDEPDRPDTNSGQIERGR